MPGWFIHLEVAKRAAELLEAGSEELPQDLRSVFGPGGPRPEELARIVRAHPNYYALGAIGPDIFFFLPDFKGRSGNFIARAAEWVIKVYEEFDEKVVGPWESKLGPISEDQNELVSRLTGGLSDEIADISQYATAIVNEAIQDFVSRLWDWFGVLGNGVGPAYDDQLFYWSDMFHYRWTNEFAWDLFRIAASTAYDENGRPSPAPAGENGYEPGIAFALGWMTHVGTDVTGHPFVNEKAGGPYRLHWQRHHLVENHMDAFAYQATNGANDVYDMEVSSALHFWVQFRDGADFTPRYDYFQGVGASVPDYADPDFTRKAETDPPGPLPRYPTGLTSREHFGRRKIFDVDSTLPTSLAGFIYDAMYSTFYDRHRPEHNDGLATHPIILDAVAAQFSEDPDTHRTGDAADGRPDLELLHTNFALLFKYIKYTSTDYYRMPKPVPPDVIPDNLEPPIAPANDDPPDPGDSSWDFWDLLLAIFSWIAYVAEWIGYLLTVLPGLVADLATYPARVVLYLFEEALYELWKAFRYLLVVEGFVLPEPDEIDLGLIQLGNGSGAATQALFRTIDDVFGGLLGDVEPQAPTEPVPDPRYPRDTVVDGATLLQTFVQDLKDLGHCTKIADPPDRRQPSEFLRPWKYPFQNNDGTQVGSEAGLTRAGPYGQGDLPTVLLGGVPGAQEARDGYERASTPDVTDDLNRNLSRRWNLGDPLHYSLYVIARLTRDGVKPEDIANFNLDADRGYAYKCWDYDRHAGYPDRSVYARYTDPLSSWSSDYPVPCTPPRQFDKFDCCGTHVLDHLSQAALDYRPGVKLAIHYLDPDGEYDHCGDDSTPPAPPVR